MAGLLRFISYRPKREGEITDKLRSGMEKAAKYVEGEAKKNCPVDTGRLRASINSKVEGEVVGIIGTTVEYASFVELGKGQPPQPFLFPALERSKAKIAEFLKNG